MKIHNKLIKSTTVAEKADLWANFIITILTRTGLHKTSPADVTSAFAPDLLLRGRKPEHHNFKHS